MFLKNTVIIVILLIIGAVALYLYLNWTSVPDGVTPQSGGETSTAAIIALAASITSLAGSVMGVLMKFLEFRSKQLDIQKKERELNNE